MSAMRIETLTDVPGTNILSLESVLYQTKLLVWCYFGVEFTVRFGRAETHQNVIEQRHGVEDPPITQIESTDLDQSDEIFRRENTQDPTE